MISNLADVFEILLKEGFSEEQITQELERKVKQFHGFISKEGALFLVAKDLGIEFQSPKIDGQLYQDVEQEIDYDEFAIPIKDLQEGMTNIVLLGKVSRVFKIKDFIRKDGSSGRVGSFLIGDATGQVKIVVWDENTKIMNSELFEAGLLIRIVEGYCKKNQKGYLEVHLGKKGKIMLNPEDISEKKKTELEDINAYSDDLGKNSIESDQSIKITDLFEKEGFIPEIRGQVKNLDLKEIDKKNREKTFLLKFLLMDETGSIQCLVWNMKAIEVLQNINNGDILAIRNVLIKTNSYTQENQLQFTKKTIFVHL
jgi:replication factor A1